MPVIRRTKRSVTLDLLALQRAIKRGKLSASDRTIAEAILPGACDKLAAQILEEGHNGNLGRAIGLILSARATARESPSAHLAGARK